MNAQSLHKYARISQLLTNALYLSLILVLTLWTYVFDVPDVERLSSVLLVRVVPLLLFLPALFSGHPKGYAWLCFIVLFYFTSGVLNCFADPGSLFGWLESSISFALFCTAMMYVRWKYQSMKCAQVASEA